MSGLKNHVALVSGGSLGIGKAVALLPVEHIPSRKGNMGARDSSLRTAINAFGGIGAGRAGHAESEAAAHMNIGLDIAGLERFRPEPTGK